MAKGEIKRVFEWATDLQIQEINRLIMAGEARKDHLEKLTARYTGGLTAFESLSLQEAQHLIGRIKNPEVIDYRPFPPKEEWEFEAGKTMPTAKQINGIRRRVAEMGWSFDHFKAWLKKYQRLRDYRAMTRKKASGIITGLMACLKDQKYRMD